MRGNVRFTTTPIYKNPEKAIGAYLELVLASLSGWGWVEEINCENLYRQRVSFRCPKSINQSSPYQYPIHLQPPGSSSFHSR
jgi:hypothetical protein